MVKGLKQEMNTHTYNALNVERWDTIKVTVQRLK
jgi:hypothetical protein